MVLKENQRNLALFTPQQMRRLDEWTDEAPLINASPGDGDREGFPDYIERSNEGMVEAREMAMASQDMLEAHGFPNGKISV